MTSTKLIIVKMRIESIANSLIWKTLAETKNPQYSEKATATAAIEAVFMTEIADHP